MKREITITVEAASGAGKTAMADFLIDTLLDLGVNVLHERQEEVIFRGEHARTKRMQAVLNEDLHVTIKEKQAPRRTA